MDQAHQVVVSRLKVFRVIVVVILAVVVAHFVRTMLLLFVWHSTPLDVWQHVVLRVLHIGEEAAVATWFTISLMLCVVALAVFIAVAERRAGSAHWRWWVGVATVFTYTSLDEQVQLHEYAVQPVRDLLGITSGPFWLAWVVPALALATALALLFSRFIARLPASTRLGMVVAIGVWLGGAIGTEMIDAATFPWRVDMADAVMSELVSSSLVVIEEGMEMLGIALLLRALLGHAACFAPGPAGAVLLVR